MALKVGVDYGSFLPIVHAAAYLFRSNVEVAVDQGLLGKHSGEQADFFQRADASRQSIIAQGYDIQFANLEMFRRGCLAAEENQPSLQQVTSPEFTEISIPSRIPPEVRKGMTLQADAFSKAFDEARVPKDQEAGQLLLAGGRIDRKMQNYGHRWWEPFQNCPEPSDTFYFAPGTSSQG